MWCKGWNIPTVMISQTTWIYRPPPEIEFLQSFGVRWVERVISQWFVGSVFREDQPRVVLTQRTEWGGYKVGHSGTVDVGMLGTIKTDGGGQDGETTTDTRGLSTSVPETLRGGTVLTDKTCLGLTKFLGLDSRDSRLSLRVLDRSRNYLCTRLVLLLITLDHRDWYNKDRQQHHQLSFGRTIETLQPQQMVGQGWPMLIQETQSGFDQDGSCDLKVQPSLEVTRQTDDIQR